MSVTQNTHHHKPLMVQAPVRALDPDGVAVIAAGTVAFAVGSLVCWWQYDALEARGDGWWFWVCVNGVLIGLIGLAFTLRRRARRRARGGDSVE